MRLFLAITGLAIAVAIAVHLWYPQTPEIPVVSYEEVEAVLAYDSTSAERRAASRSIEREAKTGQEHIHVALRVIVNGGEHHAPKTLGLIDAGPRLAIHAHDFTGIVHVHHPKDAPPWTLEDIWAVWGVRYSKDGFGPWKFSQGWKGKIYINNTAYPVGKNTVLQDHMDIVLVLASPGGALPARSPVAPFDWKTAPIRES